jgi:hypothetical protein
MSRRFESASWVLAFLIVGCGGGGGSGAAKGGAGGGAQQKRALAVLAGGRLAS